LNELLIISPEEINIDDLNQLKTNLEILQNDYIDLEETLEKQLKLYENSINEIKDIYKNIDDYNIINDQIERVIQEESKQKIDIYKVLINIQYRIDTGIPELIFEVGKYINALSHRAKKIIYTETLSSIEGSTLIDDCKTKVFKIPSSNIEISMNPVKEGGFMMGSSNNQLDRYNDEGPLHNVNITDTYYLGIYEVTQEQWEEIMGSQPSENIGDNLPVERVSWFEAIEFCNKLSDRFGLEKVYIISNDQVTYDFSKKGFRLPTEAEWEYAARGGINKDVSLYSGSDNLSEVAWFSGNSGFLTHEVGEKLPNSLGFFDMSGNVYEWCWDWYNSIYYGYSNSNNPKGPVNGKSKILRGGAFASVSKYCRLSFRHYGSPNNKTNNAGLRLAKTI